MDMLFTALKLLKYNRLKKNEHGIHSPFVFDLYVNTIKNSTHYYGYSAAEAIREEMLNDKRMIPVKDLGAGSHSGMDHFRLVKKIARTAVKNKKYSRLLFRLANHFEAKCILEIGTSLGITSAYLAIARPKSQVFTIEGCPETRKIALQNFEKAELQNIVSLEGNFDDVLPRLLKDRQTLDLVFFDGNHRKEPTLRYFNQCLENIHNESVFVFDDIYWSPGMAAAWEQIKAHPAVTVSIDLFQLGIVFFRKEQVKQHFVLSF
jgi:predicted O-methyltransferase YrrM